MDMSVGNVQVKPFQNSFFLQKGKSIFYCRKETRFAGESRSPQILTFLLLWNKKPHQTEKFFLPKIMSMSGTGNTSHFFILLLWYFLSLFSIFSIPKRVNSDPLGFEVSIQEKTIIFQNLILYSFCSIAKMRDDSNYTEQRMLACTISKMHKSPKSNTLPNYTFPHSACWEYQCTLVYKAEHILTWKHLTSLKRWKTSYFNPKYLLFYYAPS